MLNRAVMLLALSVVSLSLSATGITGRYLLPPDTMPVVIVPEAAPPAAPAPANKVKPVALRRGDTLVSALTREGLDRRVSQDIATALREGGADLRRMRPRHGLDITWNLTGEPVALH